MKRDAQWIKEPLQKRLVFIDNYDSFSHILVHEFRRIGCHVDVIRNDQPSELLQSQPDGFVISPGPGNPSESGVSCDVIRRCADLNIPMLGVCLGHQCLVEVFGGRVIKAPKPVHGFVDSVFHNGFFDPLPNPFQATRYHSLIADSESLPSCLEKTAWTHEGLIMGMRHKTKPLVGVQFHPESIMTTEGLHLLWMFCRNLMER